MMQETLGAVAYQVVFALLDQIEKEHPGITKRVLEQTKAGIEASPGAHQQDFMNALKAHFDQNGIS